MIKDVMAYLDIQREIQTLERQSLRKQEAVASAPIGPIDLVLTWARFDEDVLRDDRTLLQDYVHFLMVRDKIARLCDASSPPTRNYLESLVQPFDERFRVLTVPEDPGLTRLFANASDNWWWRVAPKDPGRELKMQFEAGRLDQIS